MYGPGYHSTHMPRTDAADRDKKGRADPQNKKCAWEVWSAITQEGPGAQAHWLYFFSKLIATIATLFLFGVLFAICGSVLFWDSPELSVFVSNSFYTSMDNEQNLSWQVLTQPAWNGLPRNPATFYNDVKFEHYYECAYVAQLGWGLCNASSSSVTSYQQCLMSQYPLQLSTCANQTSSFSWPTANVYANCMTNNLGGARWNLNAFKTCIREDLWPLYEVPQDVDSPYFLGSYSWPLIMLTGAFLFGVFALYTIYPVDWEDTTIIEYGKPLSAYSRLGVAWTVLPLLLTIFWFIVSVLVAFRASPTWPNQNNNLYPSTQQTNVVMLTATLATLFYFILEACEFQERRQFQQDGESPDHRRGDDEKAMKASFVFPGQELPMNATMGQSRLSTKVFTMPKGPRGGLGYYFPGVIESLRVGSLRDASEIYTPVLLNTWADGYLVDPLFFVGALGATLQIITADVYNIFWCLVFYRLAHVGVARLVYYSYVRSPVSGEDVNHAREMQQANGGAEQEDADAARQSIIATRVLALATHVAGDLALLVVFYIIFDTSRIFPEFPTTQNLFLTGLLVPELIRLLGHIVLAIMPAPKAQSKGVYILMASQFLWAWDLVIRVIFLWVYFWGSNGGRGTKPFLLSGWYSITSMLQFTASCCPSSASGYTLINGVTTLLCC